LASLSRKKTEAIRDQFHTLLISLFVLLPLLLLTENVQWHSEM
jgi:hypothetical protein